MLTREELLKSNEANYMDADQLLFFKDLLLSQKASLEQSIALAAESLSVAEVVADPADRASQEEVRQNMLRTQERDAAHIKQIDSAVARINAGEFGYCYDTGEPIGISRLLANPITICTVEAQHRRECMARMYAA